MSEHIKDSEVFKMLGIVVGSLAVFFVLCIIIARIVSGPGEEMGTNKMAEAATIERIKPFGEVNIGKAPVMAKSSGVDGKATYQSACFACHGTGAAGAPIMGDQAAWTKRIAQGNKVLFAHAIDGFKGMPAKGGNASLSDDAVKAAVTFMVKNSQ